MSHLKIIVILIFVNFGLIPLPTLAKDNPDAPQAQVKKSSATQKKKTTAGARGKRVSTPKNITKNKGLASAPRVKNSPVSKTKHLANAPRVKNSRTPEKKHTANAPRVINSVKPGSTKTRKSSVSVRKNLANAPRVKRLVEKSAEYDKYDFEEEKKTSISAPASKGLGNAPRVKNSSPSTANNLASLPTAATKKIILPNIKIVENSPQVTLPSAFDQYDMEDDDESSAFFGNFFTDEPGDPVDFEKYYSIARMAFLFGYYDTASQYWQPMANLGHAKSQASIGWMYQSSKGFKKNYKRAFEWYRKAAKQNHRIAQNNLGVLYEKGWGTKKNISKAAKWYKESAEWGYSFGQFNYGKLLLDGRGVKKDKNEAIYWLDLASLQGVRQANGLLGRSISSSASMHISSQSYKLKEKIWILLKNPRYFTLQLLQTSSKKKILNYLDKTNATGQYAYFVSEKKGKKIYSLIYGVFTSFAKAELAMRSLPTKMLKRPPWIRRFANIQKHIKK